MEDTTRGRLLALMACVAALGGCGGGGSPAPVPVPAPAPVVIDDSGARGALLRNPPDRVSSLDTQGVQQRIDQFGGFGVRLSAEAGAPRCGIDVHHFEYATVGAAGEQTTASGALMVPTGDDAACTGGRPIVLYGHGSSLVHATDMTELSPSAPYGTSSIRIAALFAAQGYIVVAPNYAGYDTSPLGYHPHHIADQESKDMIDALAAARKALPALARPVADDGRLFLTGYSEGGYVTMATHRAMQEAGMTVTASAPLSGAYAESVNYELTLGTPGAFDDLSAVDDAAMLQYVMQFTAWQKADGDLYASPAEIYPEAWAASMETLGPVDVPVDTLVASGKLPPHLLADDMPGYTALTPLQQSFYGTPQGSLIKTSFIGAVVADVAAHPCDVTSAVAPLDCEHPNPARKAWFKNDLRTWTPTAPMLMCGGNADPDVWYFNTQLTAAYFEAHGVAAGMATALDVDSATTANDPYAGAKAAFAAARAAVVADGGDTSSAGNYHGMMAAEGCTVAARDFFRQF